MEGEQQAQQPPVRLMQFISESKLEELKATRGATVQDGTLLPERPLHEILRENKQKQDKEFKERFKHQPPKALDAEEMEFLDEIDKVKREHDRKVATEEALELSNFDAAVAKRLQATQEPQQQQQQPRKKEVVLAGPKRPSQSTILASVVKVRPVQSPAKKAKVEQDKSEPGIIAGLVAAYGEDDDDED